MSAESTRISVIITGATGMVGEGVLLTCLDHSAIERVLIVNRRHYPLEHPKLKECLVPDFLHLEDVTSQLAGYDACFFCAGVSSVGKSEAEYTRITYDTTIHFAKTLVALNPQMVFDYVTGAHTDSTEQGRVMWARVKGKTENALTRLGFRGIYNFRPGFMRPVPGQKNIKPIFKPIVALYPLLRVLMPRQMLTLHEVGLAMIHSVQKGYPKQVLEITDIQALAKG